MRLGSVAWSPLKLCMVVALAKTLLAPAAHMARRLAAHCACTGVLCRENICQNQPPASSAAWKARWRTAHHESVMAVVHARSPACPVSSRQCGSSSVGPPTGEPEQPAGYLLCRKARRGGEEGRGVI
jgi:hypothetical protein